MIQVPSLAQVVEDRSKLIGLPWGTIWDLLLEAGRVHTEIAAALSPAVQLTTGASSQPEDRLLTIEEASDRLHVSPATMQKWLRKPPYNAAVVVRSRNLVRVSAQRLDGILLSSGPRARRKAG